MKKNLKIKIKVVFLTGIEDIFQKEFKVFHYTLSQFHVATTQRKAIYSDSSAGIILFFLE